MKVQVKRAREPLKIILFLVTKKEKNRQARAPIQVCHSRCLSPLFQNKCPFILLPPLSSYWKMQMNLCIFSHAPRQISHRVLIITP